MIRSSRHRQLVSLQSLMIAMALVSAASLMAAQSETPPASSASQVAAVIEQPLRLTVNAITWDRPTAPSKRSGPCTDEVGAFWPSMTMCRLHLVDPRASDRSTH